MNALCLFLGTVVCMHSVPAQNESVQLVDSLKEVVISASKTAEQKRDLAIQIEVLSQKQIENLMPQNTADALQKSGEVFVQKSQQGGGSPIIRGFEANKVLLVIDGVRMNNAIYRSGHLQNILTLDPSAIKRIEILHGAGAVIYGTDAIGGVISVLTKSPELSQNDKKLVKGGALLRYASANQGLTSNLNLNIGAKKWANYITMSFNQFGDLRSGNNDLKDYPNFGDRNFSVKRLNGRDSVVANANPDIQLNSGYRQFDLLNKLLYRPNAIWQHTVNLQVSNSTDIPRYDRLTDLSGSKPRFAEWYYGPQKRILVSYQMEFQPFTKWLDVVRLTPAFQSVEESRFDRRFGASTRNERTENLKIFSVNLDFFKSFGLHELRSGAEFVSNSLQSKGIGRLIDTDATSAIQSRYPEGSYTTQGLYFSHHWEIMGKKLILNDGMRFSSVQMDVEFDTSFLDFQEFRQLKQQSNSLNFNLGLVSNLNNGFRASMMISSGFRNPNIDDASKITEQANQTLHIPSSNLKPEQILHREITIGQSVGKRFELSATGFYSTLTDAIATRPTKFRGEGTVIFQGDTLGIVHSENVAKAVVSGVSIRSSLLFMQYFRCTASLIYTKGRDKTLQMPLDHIPPLMANLRVAYDRKSWQIETDVLYNGQKKLADYSVSGEDNLQYATPNGMPAWAIWNLRGAKTLSKSWRIQAAIENMLDLNYRVFASGINGAGRNFVISLSAQF
jgi:hemoglobin/transferrin/lactoferrin receptor protein